MSPTKQLSSVAGMTALVTGASSGIGAELARLLARRGARVALVARRADRLEALAAEIARAGGEAHAIACDVADRDAVEQAAARARAQLGSITLLVNNAGYGGRRPFAEWPIEDIERMMRVNYLGAVYFTRALLPDMLAAGRGWLVFVASVAGRIGPPGESAYAASKFAMVGLAEAISLELDPAGIHVLTVCPGVVRTPFFSPEHLAQLPAMARRSVVEPADLAEAILAALARGHHELTYPRALAAAYPVRALLPGLFRRGMSRATRAASRSGHDETPAGQH